MAGPDPAGLDVTTPNIARMYDYMLDGKDNFAADRDAAEKLIAMMPQLPLVARANRAFLRRAVQALVTEYGIRQFIDVGTGLPTMGNVHEVAQPGGAGHPGPLRRQRPGGLLPRPGAAVVGSDPDHRGRPATARGDHSATR